MTIYEGCCGDDKWRGRNCEYHQGYEDGLEVSAQVSEQLRTENVKLKQMLESSPPDLLIRNVSGETIVRTVPRELPPVSAKGAKA